MVCACSQIIEKNIKPKIQNLNQLDNETKLKKIQELKDYIQNHPRKCDEQFKQSMIIILQNYLM